MLPSTNDLFHYRHSLLFLEVAQPHCTLATFLSPFHCHPPGSANILHRPVEVEDELEEEEEAFATGILSTTITPGAKFVFLSLFFSYDLEVLKVEADFVGCSQDG